jgi:hypothetical protein
MTAQTHSPATVLPGEILAPGEADSELTDAELDQVAGGGGDGSDGAQPTGSER